MRRRLIALALCAPLLGASYWPMTNDSDVAAGQDAFLRGDYAAAVISFRKALRGNGSRARLHFDLGTALVQAALKVPDADERQGQLDLAIVSLRVARGESDGELRERVHYNLGNALLLRGQIDDAIASYRQVLLQNSDHDDARHNLALALRVKRSAESEDAVADALRDLAALPSEGEAGAAGQAQGQEATEGAESTGPGAGEAQGEESSARSEQAGNADATGPESQAEAQDAGHEERSNSRRPSPAPRGNQRLSLTQKLDALERRSGELRRANMLRKTESRLRMPNAKRRDQ